VQQSVNTPWFQRNFVDEVPPTTQPSPSGDLVQGSYVPPSQQDYNPYPSGPSVNLDDALAAVAVGGAVLLAPEALPVLGAVAEVGAEVATDSAVFLSTPAGQALTGYATAQLGGTGLPPANVPSFIGGRVLPNLGSLFDFFFGETDAW
jgi:hypothetical protein